MSLLLAPLVLAAAAAAAATPAPTATATPTPTPTSTPTATSAPGGAPKARSLADLARERKLVPLKGAGEAAATDAPGPLRVEDLQDNGAVSDGLLSVYGRVRNTGRVPACRVRLFFRTFDDHGVLLSKGETTTDLKTILPGDAVPFGGRLKVPPGVRGSQEREPDVLAEGPARTNWQRVARVDGEVLDFSEDCR
jgi:hypothetical protein